MSELYKFQSCRLPLLVSVPHAGTALPDALDMQLSGAASTLPDTDWFVDRLVRWVPDIGAGLIVANYSRYVVDLNRPPDDAALYQGTTPGLVPRQTFSGLPVYRNGEPDADAVRARVKQYWWPYHHAIQRELDRLRQQFGYAILFDAHSIRSHVPRLFAGNLPDLNLGSFDGQSAAAGLLKVATAVLGNQHRYSHTLDGRFKGGYITRHYGQPDQHIHALQLEMSQTVYMHEDPPEYDHDAAARAGKLLKTLLLELISWEPGHD